MKEKIGEYFTKKQKEQIELGKKQGLDTSVYAKPEYNVMQMMQIREGMLEKLDVKQYLNPAYNWLQMEEIRKGLSEGLDITSYNKIEIPYDKMREIRKGLRDGINMGPYAVLEAGILREVRRAIRAKVSIKDYIQQGYGPKQLDVIIKAEEKGLNVKPYLSKQFRSIAIQEIVTGLEMGVDVSVYAKPDFDWRYMREVRLGLENRVNISRYIHPFFDWKQMREIRLGLEEGLDVSGYAKLMYTALDMQKKRKQMELAFIENLQVQEEHRAENSGIIVVTSADEMEAGVICSDAYNGMERSAFMDLLISEGIVKGFDEENIETVLSGKQEKDTVIVVARGKKPVDGKDGWYEYFFRTEVARSPKQLEDGTVDYQNIEWFETVNESQKIVEYHSAECGTDGYTVTGKVLAAHCGKEQKMLRGKGFRLLDDKKNYISTMTGRIEIRGNELIISQLFVFDELTMAIGNLDIIGSVYIRGNVGSNVVIKATGDIAVDGFIESAVLECGGEIFLRNGVNAAGRGIIRAAGNVAGRFFEAVTVEAGADIYCNYSMDAELRAEGMIVLSGEKGSLIGGCASGIRGIQAFHIGNTAGVPTLVQIGADDKMQIESATVETKLDKVKKELELLRNAWMDMRKKYSPEVRNTMDIYIKIENAIFTIIQQNIKEIRYTPKTQCFRGFLYFRVYENFSVNKDLEGLL